MNVRIQIIEEALRLFQVYGIRSLTINDIARLAKIPVRTLNRYFPTKESLLLKCIHFRISQEEIFKYTDDSLIDILLNFADIYPVFYNHINRSRCLEIKKYYHSAYTFLFRYLDYYSTICKNKTEEGITNGYIRRTTSPPMVYEFFREHWSKLFWSKPEIIGPADKREATLEIRSFVRRIATPKGLIYIDKKMKNRFYDENN